MQNVAVMFSGGRDSSLVACLMAQQKWMVHLITCDAGDVIGGDMREYRVNELKRIFPVNIANFVVVPCYGLFRSISLANIEDDFKKYNSNLIPIGSQITYHAEGILYCLKNNIEVLATGYRESQFDCMEQMPNAAKILKEFVNEFNIEYLTPIYEYANKDDVKYRLLDFGITTKSLEGTYLFGDASSRISEEFVIEYIKDKLSICRDYIIYKTNQATIRESLE